MGIVFLLCSGMEPMAVRAYDTAFTNLLSKFFASPTETVAEEPRDCRVLFCGVDMIELKYAWVVRTAIATPFLSHVLKSFNADRAPRRSFVGGVEGELFLWRS